MRRIFRGINSSRAPVFLTIILLFTLLCFTLSARIPQQVFLEYESGRGGNDLGCLPGSLEDVFEATISFRLTVLWCGVVWCDVMWCHIVFNGSDVMWCAILVM
jgi:hypothetical protein